MIDPKSDTWLEVKKFIDSELSKSRKKLESHGVSLDETEYLRGGISKLSAVLSLATSSDYPTVTTDDYR